MNLKKKKIKSSKNKFRSNPPKASTIYHQNANQKIIKDTEKPAKHSSKHLIWPPLQLQPFPPQIFITVRNGVAEEDQFSDIDHGFDLR